MRGELWSLVSTAVEARECKRRVSQCQVWCKTKRFNSQMDSSDLGCVRLRMCEKGGKCSVCCPNVPVVSGAEPQRLKVEEAGSVEDSLASVVGVGAFAAREA